MLVLNSASVALYNNTREEMNSAYAACTNEKDTLKYYTHYKQLIEGLNSSNDEPTEEEIDAGHCSILFDLNVKLQKKALNRLLLSHSSGTIESSNTTNTQQKPMMNSTMNIESMSLQELASLQLKIAQRMQELVTNVENPKEYDIPQEKLEDVAPVVATKPSVEVVEPAPKASRVKKSKTTKSAIEVPATPVAEKATTDVSTMKYADLRSFISKATKSNNTAKEHAQSIARKYGAKSWATVGRSGYEEIFALLNK